MTEKLFAVNTIFSQELCYDILMLKIKQLFAILMRIRYDILMLKFLRSIILTIIYWLGYPYYGFILESFHNVKLAADEGKDDARRHQTKAAKK